MKQKFSREWVLYLDNDPAWKENVREIIERSDPIHKEYGERIFFVDLTRIPELHKGMINGIENRSKRPTLFAVSSDQIAYEFMSIFMPAVIVTSPEFTAYGRNIPEHLRSEGFKDYHLIALSSSPKDSLDRRLKEALSAKTITFFPKWDVYRKTHAEHSHMLEDQVIRNRIDNIRIYSK